MRTLNLGILAHVDAGKTSLTERLLFAAGAIDAVGSVDDGNTQTDTLDLERRRGITIKAAVVSFVVGDVVVNLIDTPGHPDFIAEVERVLSVLDGAVLVVSAVEGVQAQTRVLMRTLRRLGVPTLIFVNKVDRRGARGADLVPDLARALSPAVVALTAVDGLGTPNALVRRHVDPDHLLEVLAEHDDALLAAYVDGRPADPRAALAEQSRRGLVHPVFFGSASTGAGVDPLTEGITHLLPASTADPDAPVAGRVFAVRRGPAGEKIAYVRLFAGTLRVRDRVQVGGTTHRVTAISLFDHGADHRTDALPPGRIGRVWGLHTVRIDDALGVPDRTVSRQFAPPTLETVVVPGDPADRGALHSALSQLAEQDPLIDLRHDDRRGETSVSLYGEVQKEVIQATLAEEFGLAVTFRETTTIHIERVTGTGAAVELIGQEPNPFLATVGLRVEPGGDGVEFRLGVELGSMPFAFFTAVEDTVRATLGQGIHGWAVRGCVVTMTHSGYWARQSHAHGTFDKSMSSTAGDFRGLTPPVLMAALRAAGTVVHEPVHRFRLELPADALGPTLPVLAALRAVPRSTVTAGAACLVEGELPAVAVHELERRLPGLTRGEGMLESAFAHHQPVRGVAPSRPRTDHDPLNRSDYLSRVLRRAGRS